MRVQPRDHDTCTLPGRACPQRTCPLCPVNRAPFIFLPLCSVLFCSYSSCATSRKVSFSFPVSVSLFLFVCACFPLLFFIERETSPSLTPPRGSLLFSSAGTVRHLSFSNRYCFCSREHTILFDHTPTHFAFLFRSTSADGASCLLMHVMNFHTTAAVAKAGTRERIRRGGVSSLRRARTRMLSTDLTLPSISTTVTNLHRGRMDCESLVDGLGDRAHLLLCFFHCK